MSQPVPQPVSHPVLAAAAAIGEALKSVADVNPTFMDTSDKATALVELSQLEARVAELRLRVLADAGDVAERDAARDAAAWLAHHTRQRSAETRSDLRLATALEQRYPALGVALRDGETNLAQAHVIARALDALPDEVPVETVSAAEQTLVAHAADFGPRPLARLGARILQVVAPDVVDEIEGRRLAALEESAARAIRLSLRPLGDGTTRITALVPDAVASRLTTYLEAFTSPRRTTTGEPRPPHPRKLGHAFCQLLEAIDPQRLPLQGGDATSVIVTIPLETLTRDLGVADLLDGTTLTAGQARRLARTAKLLPAVLGGKSEPLDLGRNRRLFTPPQRKALLLRDHTCRAQGCDIPGRWCEAHHLSPWSSGGKTDLADGVLLCSHHHHRIHENAWRGDRLPSGDVRFHRRS